MTDPIEIGFAFAIGSGIIGMFLRIEHRLTKLETKLDNIEENITGCQPPLENPMK